MWWFLKKVDQTDQPVGGQANLSRRQTQELFLEQVPDMSALDRQDVAIKIWLPDQLARTLKWVSDYEGESQSSWVRDRLIDYVYGRVAQLAKKIREKAVADDIRFSRQAVDRSTGRWIYKVPQLGKNTVAFKVWINQQMRNDLEVLARHAGVGLSPFVREVIVGDLLGRGSLPERPEIMGSPTDAALAWERGEEVPFDSVEEGAFNHLGEADCVWLEDR